jgi:peptide/nickel transport system substrate-binding protein
MRRSRMSRRGLLRASARAGVGAAGLALVGCGDDDDDSAAQVAQQQQQQQQAVAQAQQQDQPQQQAMQQQQDQQQQQAEAQAQQTDQQEQQAAAQQQQQQQQAVATADSAREGDTDWERTVTVAVPNAVGGLDVQGPGNYTLKWNGPLHFDQLLQYDLVTRAIEPHVGYFEWIEDFTAVLMHLNPGHAWHDGMPMTAEDVKFSIDRAAGNAPYNESGVYESGIAYIVAPVNGEVTAIDDLTARIPVKSEVTAPNAIGTTMPLVPRHRIEELGDEGYNRDGLASGPFQLTNFEPDIEVRSVRNDNYPIGYENLNRKHRPWVKEVVQSVRPEPVARLAAIQAGEADVAPSLEWELVQEFVDEPGFEVLFDPGCCPHTIFPNTIVPMFEDGSNPYRDLRVRQAMNHAVDVETIYMTLGTGREQRAYGIGTRQLGGMQPEQSGPLTMEYNVEKAMQLMDAAGYADGFESDFYGTAGFFALTDQIALSVQQYLDVVGIRTNLQLDPLPDFRARMAQRDVPGLHYYFTNQSPDPFQVIAAEVAIGGTLSVAEYPETDIQDLVDAQATEFDPEKRVVAINKLAERIYTNASWLFLFETVGTGLMRDDLEWDMKGNSRDYGGLWAIRPLIT